MGSISENGAALIVGQNQEAQASVCRHSADPPTLQVLITTYDSMGTLPRLIEKLQGFDSVLVVDSGSSDGTQAFVEGRVSQLVSHPYESQSSQLNWALDNVVDADWCLVLDSDEFPLFDRQDVVLAMQRAEGSGRLAAALRRRNIAWGHWVRHGGWYPDWQVRLFKVSARLRYEDVPIHAHPVVDRPRIFFSRLELEHQTYRSVDDYWSRLARATTREATTRWSWGMKSARPRAGRLKVLSRLIPGRPFIWFVYRYLWRGGFLDGRVGWHLALWSAVYYDVVNAKRSQRERSSSFNITLPGH